MMIGLVLFFRHEIFLFGEDFLLLSELVAFKAGIDMNQVKTTPYIEIEVATKECT